MSSKRYKVLPQDTRKLKADTFENLLQVIKKNSTAKFDESIDINFQLNLKKKKEEMNIRNVLNLPSGTGTGVPVEPKKPVTF